MIKKKTCLIFSVFLLFVFSVPAWADVTIHTEGAYTETDLAVYIYADISGDAILSAGVKLTYSQAELTLTSAIKNEKVWYMGDGSSNEAYMDPDTSVAGEVVIICGKLDSNEGHTLDGVSGNRVLIGILRFNRINSTMPFAPTLALDYGKADPYDNFVETDGDALDTVSVTFGDITVRECGDADADEDIDVFDIMKTKIIIEADGYSVWADCDGDNDIDVFDIMCIKNKI